MTRMTLALTLAAALTLSLPGIARAEVAAVAVESTGELDVVSGLRILTLQALQDRGFTTVDSPQIQATSGGEELAKAAAGAGAARLFVLHAAPVAEAMVVVLEELDLAHGASLYRASLMIEEPGDADRVVKRLVASVLDRKKVGEGTRIETVTAHEGRPYAKKPGEFLWGFSVLTGFAKGPGTDTVAIYGGTLRFLYEMPHVNFGVDISGAGSGDSGLFDLTVRAHYLFLDGDISPYVGGGIGISSLWVNGYDVKFGAIAKLAAGVELFRLHAARLFVGVDVNLPFFKLPGDSDWVTNVTTHQTVEQKKADAWFAVPMLTVGIVW